MKNVTVTFLLILFICMKLMLMPAYSDPLNIQWGKPKRISNENNQLLRSDLSIISDKDRMAVVWIQGKVGDSSIFIYRKDNANSYTLQITAGHEDRDPRIFKFKNQYYILFSRKIMEKKDDEKIYITPYVLMIMKSPDLKLWSEPEIIRINQKNTDNIEPFPMVVENNLIIFWIAGNQNFKLWSSKTEDLANFSKPEALWNKQGMLHYPFIVQTGEES
ncbi:MAG TPA: hypothetical protein ENN73_05140, partial [Firmicutes bacterium]|nr:hypothetical protein [Bacillota bacterium]